MSLPSYLLGAIERETAKLDGAVLARAAAEITERYKREGFASAGLMSAAHRAAYLAVRMPATYAAARHVFSEVKRLAPEVEIRSMVDLGAGPGTAFFPPRRSGRGLAKRFCWSAMRHGLSLAGARLKT